MKLPINYFQVQRQHCAHAFNGYQSSVNTTLIPNYSPHPQFQGGEERVLREKGEGRAGGCKVWGGVASSF